MTCILSHEVKNRHFISTDPDSFCQRGPTLTKVFVLVYEEKEDQNDDLPSKYMYIFKSHSFLREAVTARR